VHDTVRRRYRVAKALALVIKVDDTVRRRIVIAIALLFLELLPKGKTIFPFLGVLVDNPTMTQCEDLVVIGRLEELQSFDNLYIDNGLMHKQDTSTMA
jgi:hypothetical protein